MKNNQKGGYGRNTVSTEVFGNPNTYVRNDPKYDQTESKNEKVRYSWKDLSEKRSLQSLKHNLISGSLSGDKI